MKTIILILGGVMLGLMLNEVIGIVKWAYHPGAKQDLTECCEQYGCSECSKSYLSLGTSSMTLQGITERKPDPAHG